MFLTIFNKFKQHQQFLYLYVFLFNLPLINVGTNEEFSIFFLFHLSRSQSREPDLQPGSGSATLPIRIGLKDAEFEFRPAV